MEFRPAPFILAIGLSLFVRVLSPALAAEEPVPRPQAQSPAQAVSPTFSLSGMLAGTGLARFDTTFEPFFSLRFIPELTFSLPAGRGLTLDAEISANAYGDVTFLSDASTDASAGLKPYRGWLRLSTPRFEARVGLQKLSFGPATLFRPLMWFDSLDPRDPLQITNGVYGLLLRYYSTGNANVWAWSLYGNKDRRGFDLAPPDNKSPEFGGRLEVPLFKGEIGATYHHRKAAIDGLTPIMSPGPASPLPSSLFPVPPPPRTASASTASGTSASASGSKAPLSISARRFFRSPFSAPSPSASTTPSVSGAGSPPSPSTSGSPRPPEPSLPATA